MNKKMASFISVENINTERKNKMIDKIITIGFIGNGKSANRYHMPYILTRKDKFKVKTMYSPETSSIWAPIEGVTYTDKLDDLLKDPEIDLVIVSVPAGAHYECAKAAIEAGKNCVVEKPFVEETAQAKELFALAKEKGVMLQAYQNRRFDSDFLTVQKVIESGKLGDLLEVESHYDYYRPYFPESVKEYSKATSYLYGHACHTFDQIISYFGKPDKVHYDVRQLLGENRMNDYFDVDMYYGTLKVSVKSSYFRVKSRPKFVVYGKKGYFEKVSEDRQEYDLKHFYMPDHDDFGKDRVEDYGTLIYYDDEGNYHEEKVVSENGNYAMYYDALYETLAHGTDPLVKPEQTILLVSMLEEGTKDLR